MATKQRTLSKKAVLRTLKEMPERFDADELIERIVLLQKVEEGLADAKVGRVLSMAEVRAHIERRGRVGHEPDAHEGPRGIFARQ